MKIYMAPMEGITNYSYRRIHAECYGSVDKYFTPFIVPSRERALRTRERQDILPANNQGIRVIPQILTNQADLFVMLAKNLEQMGYTEVNLNLGCPSGTVTSKGRGAGFLREPLLLDAFLEQVFDQCPISISVKSRIGVEDTEEFERLLMIYNRYPMTELILHPRLLTEKYQGLPHMEVFHMAATLCAHPLIYNGNLFTTTDVVELREQYPEERYPWLTGIMLGRGLIANPGLAAEIEGRPCGIREAEHFHNRIYEEKKRELSGDKNLLYHMKELWFYMIQSFENSEKDMKKLRKITKAAEYEAWAREMFRSGTWNTSRGFCPPVKAKTM